MNNTAQLRSAIEQQLTRGCLNEAGNMLWRPSCASSNCTKSSRYGPWRYLGLQDASVRDCDQPNGTHCETPTEWGLLPLTHGTVLVLSRISTALRRESYRLRRKQ